MEDDMLFCAEDTANNKEQASIARYALAPIVPDLRADSKLAVLVEVDLQSQNYGI